MWNALFWIVLSFLFLWTLSNARERNAMFSRPREDWWIDGANLVLHLFGLPFLQALVLLKVLKQLAPGSEGILVFGPWGSLLLYVLLDYLWYWNHRLLHSYTWVWNLHAVHHSATQIDCLTTARNSVWSHFFEVYMWFIAASVYLLRDSKWFLVFVTLGSLSNFWSHTRLVLGPRSRAYSYLSKVFITPHEHHWHHSTSHPRTNFGTVFSLWDRLHGTIHAPGTMPEAYGSDYLRGALRQLVFPIRLP